MRKTESWKNIQPQFFTEKTKVVIDDNFKDDKDKYAIIERKNVPKNIGDMSGWIGARDGVLLLITTIRQKFSAQIKGEAKDKPFEYFLNQLFKIKSLMGEARPGSARSLVHAAFQYDRKFEQKGGRRPTEIRGGRSVHGVA